MNFAFCVAFFAFVCALRSCPADHCTSCSCTRTLKGKLIEENWSVIIVCLQGEYGEVQVFRRRLGLGLGIPSMRMR